MGGETKREESLREQIDCQLGVCVDTQAKMREIVCYLAAELLPSEEKAKAEAEKPTPEPQGWFEEILHRLSILRAYQRVTTYNLERLRGAVATGTLKKAG